MGRNAKVGIAAAVVLVLVVITFVMQLQLAMIAVVLIGGIGIFVLLQQDDDDDDDDGDGGSTATKTKPTKAKKGKARLDEILDDKAAKAGGSTTTRTPTPTPPASGGLPTWTPGSVDAGAADEEDLLSSEDTGSSWDTWEKEWPSDADKLILEDDDPLASLDRLDDIDPVAEVERLDATDEDPFASLRSDIEIDTEVDIEVDGALELDELSDLDDEPIGSSSDSAFSFAAAPAVINEEVSTADDIMAASTATELHVEEAGDSELARLLAKVQARLSAYE